MKNNFIKGTNEFNTLEKAVAAPYIRKSFNCDIKTVAKITVAACGFYELYVNGEIHTKGYLAPYISNSDDYIYYDEYDIPLDEGENVLGIILGNGFHNNPGGYIWEFDKASFRSAPMVSVSVEYKNGCGDWVTIRSDKSFKTAPSPIMSDDYRFGEVYDANAEIVSWNEKGFDDSGWDSVIETTPPKGDLKLCEATPIIKEREIKPVNVFLAGESYIYDFGEVNAGVCRLVVDGKAGQKIELQHADLMVDGDLAIEPIWFVRDHWERDKNLIQKDIYICKGHKGETYVPKFTYHGFRYVKVTGITKEQATKSLLTYLVLHSDIETRGDFSCSDETINKLQEITRRSDVSNYHYFPTDCPQREKNGWTADAALSCEQMLLNFNPEVNYREWLFNIRKAQREDGALPGIVPTTGWGYHWGNGPAWDCVLAYLPYYTYIYRGETEMIIESAESLTKYFNYLKGQLDENGLIHIGLGDWCQVGRPESPTAPLVVTDSITAMDIARKIAIMFDATGMYEEAGFAKGFADSLKKSIRNHLIDYDSMTVMGNCQTSQAMGLYYDLFTDDERLLAFEKLLQLIHAADDHIDVGVLGGRVIFHVLSQFGHSELAYKMITRPDYPSYGNWLERGATTLWEDFFPDDAYSKPQSMNHHFWGDISAWFIKTLSGINLNPQGNDINHLEIRPSFVKALDFAQGYITAPSGKINSSWKREKTNIILEVDVPENMIAKVILENGYSFSDGTCTKIVRTGKYEIQCQKTFAKS